MWLESELSLNNFLLDKKSSHFISAAERVHLAINELSMNSPHVGASSSAAASSMAMMIVPFQRTHAINPPPVSRRDSTIENYFTPEKSAENSPYRNGSSSNSVLLAIQAPAAATTLSLPTTSSALVPVNRASELPAQVPPCNKILAYLTPTKEHPRRRDNNSRTLQLCLPSTSSSAQVPPGSPVQRLTVEAAKNTIISYLTPPKNRPPPPESDSSSVGGNRARRFAIDDVPQFDLTSPQSFSAAIGQNRKSCSSGSLCGASKNLTNSYGSPPSIAGPSRHDASVDELPSTSTVLTFTTTAPPAVAHDDRALRARIELIESRFSIIESHYHQFALTQQPPLPPLPPLLTDRSPLEDSTNHEPDEQSYPFGASSSSHTNLFAAAAGGASPDKKRRRVPSPTSSSSTPKRRKSKDRSSANGTVPFNNGSTIQQYFPRKDK